METQIQFILFVSLIHLCAMVGMIVIVLTKKQKLKRVANEPHDCHCHICGKGLNDEILGSTS